MSDCTVILNKRLCWNSVHYALFTTTSYKTNDSHSASINISECVNEGEKSKHETEEERDDSSA